MSSDDESGTDNVVSERETQFIPRSDDDQVLWEVQEITAERGKEYKVKWVGTDPATRKPWAQSWVAKHDCTDKLVAEWKVKKRKKEKTRPTERKKRGHTGTTSRASSSSKRAASSTSGKKAHSLASEAKSSRLDSVEQPHYSPPKKSRTKRKRRSETPATMPSGPGKDDEQGELSRPRKKQKTVLDVLLPPISSSDEDGDALYGPTARATATLNERAPPKSNAASLDVSDEDDSSPPKVKGRPMHRSDARAAGTAVSSRASNVRVELASHHSKTKTNATPQRKERVVDTDVRLDMRQDEELRPSKSKKKPTSKRKSPLERNDDLSGKEAESILHPIKIGPPRGVKRRGSLEESRTPRKPVTPRAKPGEGESDMERVSGDEWECNPCIETSSQLMQQDSVDNPTSNLPRSPSIRHGLPNARRRSPDLSPGARARLQLFDRMMADTPRPDAIRSPADGSKGVADDAWFETQIPDGFDAIDPPQSISPPPSRSEEKRSKPGAPNGLVVPKTKSLANSPSQSRSLLQPPPPCDQLPRTSLDLPTIAVVAASAAPSSVSTQDPFPQPEKPSLHTRSPSKRQTFKPIIQISPNTFRSTINISSHVTDSEAPPSSIESFASPQRVNKGKQREVEDDQLQSSLSDGEEDGGLQRRLPRKKVTDSELRKRGNELFEQAQLAREAERQKKKKAQRLKAVHIVHKTISSPPKASSLPVISGTENASGPPLEEPMDISGCANSTTLDTPQHSEVKPLSEEERERLRIELRQEEEETTQEAMDSHPPPFVKISEATDNGNSGDAQMPAFRSPRKSLFSGQNEDTDIVDQPSTDLQQASVIVQPSQEQRQEDTDIEPFSSNQPASSPPRLIPENLTDSPKRRLGEALSLLNVKSEEIQRLERELADERKNLQELKIALAEIQRFSGQTGPVLTTWEAERAQWTQEKSKWENNFSEWRTQRKDMSEERADLSARVTELSDAVARTEEAKVKLEDERDAWIKERDTAQNGMALRTEELSAKVREHDQDRLKWETERASWVEEKAGWETKHVALQEKQEALLRSADELTLKVESMTAAKVSAEKDREFFREQYVQASGFVNSVREENMDLEKRAKIAEGQAQEGVAAIKALFEGRIKALQADADHWRGLAGLLQEKDRRTNDELRLRAAQTPELRDLCDRLEVENTSLKTGVRRLEQARQRSVIKRKKLYIEIFALKKERASLRKSQPSQSVKAADTGTQEASHSVPAPTFPEDPESMDPNDIPFPPDLTSQSSDVGPEEVPLFPCLWRPHWRDQCQHVFDTREDLERHMQVHFRDLLTQ